MPQAFEDLFSKWDYDNDGALSFGQFFELIRGNRVAADPFGVSFPQDLLRFDRKVLNFVIYSGELRYSSLARRGFSSRRTAKSTRRTSAAFMT